MKIHKSNGESGVILPMTILIGTVIGIFAMGIAFMLIQELKDTHRVVVGAHDMHAADGAIDRAVNELKVRDNWDLAPNISRYKDDYIYRDLKNMEYRIRIDRGNLVEPPGDIDVDRTITVTLRDLRRGHLDPQTKEISDFEGDLRMDQVMQAVVSKMKFVPSVSADAGIVLGGNAELFWGDAYNFSETAPMTLANSPHNVEPTGDDGQPDYYSANDIQIDGGSNPLYDEPGQHPDMFPWHDLPDPPEVKFDVYRARAKFLDWGDGREGFYYKQGDSDYPPNSWDDIENGRLKDYFDLVCGGSECRSDDHVFFIDTQDGKDPLPGGGNFADFGAPNNAFDFKAGKCVGTIIIMGNVAFAGHGNLSVSMEPPQDTRHWLPDTTETSTKCNLSGMIYCAGDFKWTGVNLIYGAIICDGKFDGTGTIEVYYRYDFPYDGIKGGEVAITRWHERLGSYRVPTPTP